MFARPRAGDFPGGKRPHGAPDWSGKRWFFRKWGLFGTIYIIVGIVIAWLHHYITIHLLLLILSALLAIFLWWLPLLGVSLHLHH